MAELSVLSLLLTKAQRGEGALCRSRSSWSVPATTRPARAPGKKLSSRLGLAWSSCSRCFSLAPCSVPGLTLLGAGMLCGMGLLHARSLPLCRKRAELCAGE